MFHQVECLASKIRLAVSDVALNFAPDLRGHLESAPLGYCRKKEYGWGRSWIVRILLEATNFKIDACIVLD
jgi:hypothetical protein